MVQFIGGSDTNLVLPTDAISSHLFRQHQLTYCLGALEWFLRILA